MSPSLREKITKKTLPLIFMYIFGASGLYAVPNYKGLIAKNEHSYRSINMSGHVFVVSEWLPKEGCEQELWNNFKKLMALTKENEKGCIRAHATQQIPHPGAPGKSKYKIILLQEYVDIEAFDLHCSAPYVKEFVKEYMANEENSLIEEWQCRLLSEEETVV